MALYPIGLINTAQWDLDLQGMIMDLPATARWDSIIFSVSITQLDSAYSLTLTGNLDQIVFEAIVPASFIATVTEFYIGARIEIMFPSLLTYTNYNILGVRKSADGVAYSLTLSADHRNNG